MFNNTSVYIALWVHHPKSCLYFFISYQHHVNFTCGFSLGGIVSVLKTCYRFILLFFPQLSCVQGPVYLLEDGKSAISLNDALMWAKVNPFSPLGTGIRLNPF